MSDTVPAICAVGISGFFVDGVDDGNRMDRTVIDQGSIRRDQLDGWKEMVRGLSFIKEN